MITSFHTWIRIQTEREDPVGRLAREVSADDRAPEGIWKANWLDHLMVRNAGLVTMAAFEEAWGEYSTQFLDKYR
ncbi:YozE family protein [Paraburkholderia sp. J67]|uniref:YozE family protein n=1 Tax=Paraburkholderia sp. J67 TaxID=2805435 RepID=UPI002ABDC46F|nr:YozE family protein [Paraburkholderia sp. J67]